MLRTRSIIFKCRKFDLVVRFIINPITGREYRKTTYERSGKYCWSASLMLLNNMFFVDKRCFYDYE